MLEYPEHDIWICAHWMPKDKGVTLCECYWKKDIGTIACIIGFNDDDDADFYWQETAHLILPWFIR